MRSSPTMIISKHNQQHQIKISSECQKDISKVVRILRSRNIGPNPRNVRPRLHRLQLPHIHIPTSGPNTAQTKSPYATGQNEIRFHVPKLFREYLRGTHEPGAIVRFGQEQHEIGHVSTIVYVGVEKVVGGDGSA